nr:retrovirus-related Pol polyprotein from transposon TNT 1-94 [Tanacetum cinerariifolium]
MNDLKRNKHFPEKIASNLKFLNNLQPEWSRYVTIVHQTKDLHTADYTQLYDFLKYNQKEVDELKAERIAKIQDPLALVATPTIYIMDPTTAMNMALALMAKAFKLNYSTPTNNNQRISSNPRNRQIAQPAILSGADNRPPMLEKDMYDSWKSRMELYMLNRPHGRMILESVEQGPLIWASVEVEGVTRLKKYSELSAAETIQADCDVKETNIILQGLPSKVYALVSTQKVAKELYERIQMLMQGTSLTKQKRECKLYDAFDKFAYPKAKETELEDHLRNVKSSLNKASVVDSKATSSVIKSVSNVNLNLKCVSCNGCLFSDNHDACVVAYINSVNTSRKSKSVNTPVKRKVVQIVLWYLDSGCSKHMTGDHSQLINFVQKFLGTVKFRNDHVAKIMGYGDYQIGNVTISWVYYVEGLGHNLFSVGQFYDSDLEVAFLQHTYFIRNLEGVDLLTGSRGNNLYTLSLQDMMASSPICLLSKASKTKSWLWHRRLSHLNFGAINHLARQCLVRGLPKLKFKKIAFVQHVPWARAPRKLTNPNLKTPTKKNFIFFIWIFAGQCVRLNVPVRRIRTDNGTEFVNQTLRDYYEEVGISHETSVARSPQQNGVVERHNRTLIEAARTMLIYAQAPLFLWAE